MIFSTRCAGCDAPGSPICTTCRFALASRSTGVTASGVEWAMPFAGRARDVLLGFKYRNRRQVGRHLAGLIVNRLVASGGVNAIDVVTWAPTTRRRRCLRGFDQGELLARCVGRQLGRPVRSLLVREADPAVGGDGQTGRTRGERLDAVHFRAKPGLHDLNVLVVDDVVTTGATLAAAAVALRGAGARRVRLVAAAATPAPAATVSRVPARRGHLRAVA